MLPEIADDGAGTRRRKLCEIRRARKDPSTPRGRRPDQPTSDRAHLPAWALHIFRWSSRRPPEEAWGWTRSARACSQLEIACRRFEHRGRRDDIPHQRPVDGRDMPSSRHPLRRTLTTRFHLQMSKRSSPHWMRNSPNSTTDGAPHLQTGKWNLVPLLTSPPTHHPGADGTPVDRWLSQGRRFALRRRCCWWH